MLKLANQVIDAYDDVGLDGLKKLAELKPDLQVMSVEDRAALRDSDFALTLITKKASKLNKFPINSHDSTWLSNQFFEMNCHKLPDSAAKIAAANIKVACAKFKIEPAPSVTVFASMSKTAQARTFFEGSDTKPSRLEAAGPDLTKIAAVNEIGENYTAAQYAMRTPAAVKIAARFFEEKHKDLDVESRHKYAAAVQRRANELGMAPEQGAIGKYASNHYSGMVDVHVRARASLLHNSDHKSTLSKLGSMRDGLAPADFARALFAFDKKAGLARYYGSHLTDPFLATFAAQPDQNPGRVKIGSSLLDSDELKKLASEKYAKIRDYFGESIASEFRRDPQTIFDSLPLDSKEVMAGIFNGTA